MIKNSFLLFLLLCIAQMVLGQWRIIDQLTKDPIPAVSVFGQDGTLLAISDKDGEIALSKGQLAKGNSLTFQHISYFTKEINVSEALLRKELMLEASALILPEIEVSAREPEWLVLKGYFRSLETFDSKHKYFADGIVTYYIPLINKKASVKRSLGDYRVFGNAETIAAFKEVMGPFIEPPTIPYLPKEVLASSLSKSYVIKEQGAKRIFEKEGMKVGEMFVRAQGGVQSYIDFVQPDSIIKKKMFRLEGIRRQQVRIETYTGNSQHNVDLRRLNSFYNNTVGEIKRKKKKGYFPYERLSEFYVLERSYISADALDKLKGSFVTGSFLPEKSSFSTSFWLDLEKQGVSPIPTVLAKQLGGELVLF